MSRPSDRETRSTGKPSANRPRDAEKPGKRVSPDVLTDEVASIHTIRSDKPHPGQKRRSSHKRHQVGVVRELHLHPEVSPTDAGRVVRTRPADVIDVRSGVNQRQSETESQEPASLTDRIYEQARAQVLKGLEKVLDTIARAVTLPGEALRTIRALRNREA